MATGAHLAPDPPPEAILCARCSAAITRSSDACEVEGLFTHTRVNPAGVAFTFGCFAAAQGATVAGPPTQDATWFAGYAWQLALCGACGAHLGWAFQRGEEDRFFGLILRRLVFPA